MSDNVSELLEISSSGPPPLKIRTIPQGEHSIEALIHPKEQLYFGISLVVSILIYVLLVVSIVGVVYILLGAAIGLIVHGYFIGHIRGNAIRVSEKQFQEVYRIASELSLQMGLNPVPAIYILQAGGVLNAFATKFLGRNFIVIYSDVLELAYEKGEAELAFVLSHELAHIKRKHLTWRWLLYPSNLIPFLSQAYSRSCEYTCDRFGAHFRPNGAIGGLLVLSAGKKLFRNVNAQEFSNQTYTETGFWVWFSEILSSHPHLMHRITAIGGTAVTK
ncbi:MAG TPA: M48 family metallopeptidase [Bacteroidota bacterium]|nr:M48 family metallopeptidase [Bacteroidota bacterium]